MFGKLTLQPDGLKRGDRYRLLFTTSKGIDGTSSDIEVYNEFVQSIADAAPVVGSWRVTWKAIVSTTGTHAADNADLRFDDVEEGVPVYRLDGEFIGSNDKRFFPNAIDRDSVLGRFNLTELETVLPNNPPNRFFGGSAIWIGTSGSGQVVGPLGLAEPGAEDLGAFWTGPRGLPAELELSIIAISEIITAVPEPSSASIVWSSVFAIILIRCRCKQHRR